MTGADWLITRSISHNEIAHAEWNSDLAASLSASCDDSVRNDDVHEFWGEDDDGSEWRVHLTGLRRATEDAQEQADDERSRNAYATSTGRDW